MPTFGYTVQKGDTLYGIGKNFGITVEQIEDINDIDDPRELRIGSIIRIPSSATGRAKPAVVRTDDLPDHKASAASAKTVKLTLARKYIGKMVWPVKGGRLNSHFGNRWTNFHEGIDIASPIGTQILSAHGGLVVYSDDTLRGYGNVVVVKGEGLLTVYGHCNKSYVKPGRYVKAGTVIAEVGNTGKSSGPHLHFETRVKSSSGQNVAVDPLVFYP